MRLCFVSSQHQVILSMYKLDCAQAIWFTDFPVPALRFSISNDLKFDAERDLKDIDAPIIPVHALNKVSAGGIGLTTWVLLN